MIRCIICQVTHIPWNEEKLASETEMISSELLHLNKNGVLTINSQPRVDGELSTHPQIGWGKPGGYVYQKVRILQLFKACAHYVRTQRVWAKASQSSRLVWIIALCFNA